MSKDSALRELGQALRRLRDEPDNLGLRVQVAGALRETGRHEDAVELYRSVAIAYRDQGRTQQAIAVCRSILEFAPHDPVCEALLEVLLPPANAEAVEAVEAVEVDVELDRTPDPARHSPMDLTPLPVPLPYHIADPTARLLERFSASELEVTGVPHRPDSEEATHPEYNRAIAAMDASHDEDLAVELDTRKRPRIETGEMAKISGPPPTVPVMLVDLDDDLVATLPPPPSRADDEQTVPREVPETPDNAATRGAFFSAIPTDRRAGVLARFVRKTLPVGSTIVKSGETGHPLVLVERGVLEARVGGDEPVTLARIEAGDFYGEATLMSRSAARMSLVAASEVELLVLSARDFYELTGLFPQLWKSLADRHASDTESD
ncbi:MAG TPA: cyclic nucleotide-binding domain-containing protein [Kofleriaceae bacterium]